MLGSWKRRWWEIARGGEQREELENVVLNRQVKAGTRAIVNSIPLFDWKRAYGMENLALLEIRMADNLCARLP